LPTISSATFAVLIVGVVVATVVDIRTRRIPNTVTAAMAGAGLGLAAFDVGGVSLVAAVLGLALGLLLMLPGHVLGATGAGDVKLMAAIGSLVGPSLVVKAFLFTAVAGGVLAVIVAMQRRRLAVTFAGTAKLIAAPADARSELQTAAPSSRFAYGPAIAIGSIIAVFVG
jgi:prepilin peptidase CpaA